MISIITVCFNSAKTSERTINSVLSQSFENVEYIIIDGGSTDGTIEIIKKYQENISFWISESDSGLYDAMNKGIQRAQGEIIGILNSDDVFTSFDILSKVFRVFKEKPEIEATVGNIIQRDQNGEIKRFYSSKHWNPNKLKIGFMPPHPSIFFKKKLFEKYGKYQINFKSGADYELIVRFFIKFRISWCYTDITTTSMLIGGISSSGLSSYVLITKEIKKALEMNNIKYSNLLISSRIVWKLISFLKK